MKTERNIYAYCQGTYDNEEFIGYERAKKFIRSWENWEKCFPTHVLLWLVNDRIRMKEACAIHYTPTSFGEQKYLSQRYELLPEIKKSVHFVEERGEWHRDCYENAYQYVVPAQSQSIRLAGAFKEAIYMAYPYLKKYDFDAYVPEYTHICEIYIKMRYKLEDKYVDTLLYCPLEALLKKDPEMITQRHYNYNSKYYERQPDCAKAILGVLNSQKYKAFCKKVKGE